MNDPEYISLAGRTTPCNDKRLFDSIPVDAEGGNTVKLATRSQSSLLQMITGYFMGTMMREDSRSFTSAP